MKVLDPIWQENPEIARRICVRNRLELERVFDHAKANGHRQGDNRARRKGHLQNLMAKNEKAVDLLEKA